MKRIKSQEVIQSMPRKNLSEKPLLVSTNSPGAAPAQRKSPIRKRAAYAGEHVAAAASVEMVAAELSMDSIAQLAYSYWEQRGYQGGSAEEDWLRAERELRGAK
jgi:DUF2934 family protein